MVQAIRLWNPNASLLMHEYICCGHYLVCSITCLVFDGSIDIAADRVDRRGIGVRSDAILLLLMDFLLVYSWAYSTCDSLF